jgi:hypothetical protein
MTLPVLKGTDGATHSPGMAFQALPTFQLKALIVYNLTGE